MADSTGSYNRWTDRYAHAFDGLEERATAKIVGIKILDSLAAQKGCTGFGLYLLDCNDQKVDLLPVEGYEHSARHKERYEHLYEDLVTSGESFADEQGFLSLHATVFAGFEGCGRYRTTTGGIRLLDDDGEARYIYTATPPEDKPRELRCAFEAYGAACTAHPELSMAYLGILSVHVNHIHPFQDGNGRCIRILVASELTRMCLRKSADIPLALTGKKMVTAILLRHSDLYDMPEVAPGGGSAAIPDYSRFSHLGEHGLAYLDMLLAAYRLLLTCDDANSDLLNERIG